MRTPSRAGGSSLSLEELARQAQRGNAQALDSLLCRVQGRIYALAVRMLWCPDDGRDATQEILLRIATRLSSFRGDSSFMTWVYRVTVNYLNSARKEKLEDQDSFESVGRELAADLSGPDPSEDPMQMSQLLDEIKAGRSIGMLSCLDRAHRIAYILGEMLGLDGEEAALILEIPAATYRKRLSRARADMIHFMRSHCGLNEEPGAHRCRRRARAAACEHAG